MLTSKSLGRKKMSEGGDVCEKWGSGLWVFGWVNGLFQSRYMGFGAAPDGAIWFIFLSIFGGRGYMSFFGQ